MDEENLRGPMRPSRRMNDPDVTWWSLMGYMLEPLWWVFKVVVICAVGVAGFVYVIHPFSFPHVLGGLLVMFACAFGIDGWNKFADERAKRR